MNRKLIILLLTIIAILLVLANCVPNIATRPGIETPQPTKETPFPTSSPSLFPIPSKSFPYPTLTLIPTILPSRELHMVELLQSIDCKLPCYLSITPGKTSWSDAKILLTSLGASYSGDYLDEGSQAYSYSLWVGDPSMQTATRTTKTGVGDMEISQDVSFTVNDGIVQRIVVSIQTDRFVSKYLEYWSRYSLSELFLVQGKPDTIYSYRDSALRGAGGITIVYEKSGIVMEFYGFINGNVLCPKLESGLVTREFILTNPKSSLSIYLPDRVPPTDRSIWLPIQEVLGINDGQFYNRVVSDPSACFQIK